MKPKKTNHKKQNPLHIVSTDKKAAAISEKYFKPGNQKVMPSININEAIKQTTANHFKKIFEIRRNGFIKAHPYRFLLRFFFHTARLKYRRFLKHCGMWFLAGPDLASWILTNPRFQIHDEQQPSAEQVS